MKLSAAATALLEVIRRAIRDEPHGWMTVHQLRARDDVDRRTLDAALAELEDRRIILVRGGATTGECRIDLGADPWAAS